MIFDLRQNMSKKMKDKDSYKVIFMGTGPFAAPLLKTIIAQEKWHLIATVTKPDRKIGRGRSNQRNFRKEMIKEYSLTHDASILQPEKLDDDFIKEIKELSPDVIIVASYGKILPQALLDIPEFGVLNIHASLLPELRGASPIQNAILSGKKKTGITLMKMDAGLDTGDIITQSEIAITPEDTTPILTEKLSALSTELLTTSLPQWLAGKLSPQEQNEKEATLCQLIERADGHITWSDTTKDLYNRYRALIDWPGIFCFWHKEATDSIRIKLTKITRAPELTTDLSIYIPGTVFTWEKKVYVRTSDHAIEIISLQREGSKEVSAQDFVNGNPSFIGSRMI